MVGCARFGPTETLVYNPKFTVECHRRPFTGTETKDNQSSERVSLAVVALDEGMGAEASFWRHPSARNVARDCLGS